jgi:phage terminase large subunit
MEAIDDRIRGTLPEGHFYQITMSFNPVSAAHWIKTKLVDYADTNADIFVHKSTFLDNIFIDNEYKRRMERRREVDPEGFKIYGLGEWGELGGLIFDNVVFGDCAGKKFDNYSIGFDFGFSHATVALLLGYDGENNVYVLSEAYSTGETTAEFIKRFDKAKMPRDVNCWCEPAEPARIKELKQNGLRAFPVKKEKNSIGNQITWLKGRKIYVDGRCSNTMRELQQYKWQKNPVSGEYMDTPVTFNDDTIAALRYGIEPMRKQTRLRSMSKKELGIW